MDKLLQGLQVTVIGLVVVFVALFILVAIVRIITVCSNGIGKVSESKAKRRAEKSAKKQSKSHANTTAKPQAADVAVAAVQRAPDGDLIAVLAAAAAAMMSTSPSRIVVRSVKRTGGRRSVWSRAGRAEQLSNRI